MYVAKTYLGRQWYSVTPILKRSWVRSLFPLRTYWSWTIEIAIQTKRERDKKSQDNLKTLGSCKTRAKHLSVYKTVFFIQLMSNLNKTGLILSSVFKCTYLSMLSLCAYLIGTTRILGVYNTSLPPWLCATLLNEIDGSADRHYLIFVSLKCCSREARPRRDFLRLKRARRARSRILSFQRKNKFLSRFKR